MLADVEENQSLLKGRFLRWKEGQSKVEVGNRVFRSGGGGDEAKDEMEIVSAETYREGNTGPEALLRLLRRDGPRYRSERMVE